jgi:Ca-activated chloride channel family protein
MLEALLAQSETHALAATADLLGMNTLASGGGEAWIAFDRPLALLPVPLLVGLFVLPLLWQHHRTRRAWVHFGVRVAVLLLTCLALAEPRWTWTTKRLDLVVVRDVSDSIPAASSRALDQFLASARPEPDRLERIGEVRFASSAVVVSRPSDQPLSQGSPPAVVQDASNLESGLTLGVALAAPDAGLRLLLASDGNETSGQVLRAVRALQARAVPVDVLPLPAERNPWALLRSFTLPAKARAGSTVQASVDLESLTGIRGELIIRRGLRPGDTGSASDEVRRAVDVPAGRQRITFPLDIGESAIERFDATLVTADAGDVDPAALRATGLVVVDTPGRTLLVAPEGVDTSRLSQALDTMELRSERIPPHAAPNSLDGWAAYDSVILAGISAEELGPLRMEQLRLYVDECAGGLVVLGGRQGFARDWLDTPLEESLPVSLRLPEDRMPSRGAVVLVIDRSGSMSAMVGVSGRSQQDFACEAAIASLASLSRADFVSVVAFDSQAAAVVPLRKNDSPAEIARLIRSIQPGGGTDVGRAIDAAAAELARTSITAKHIVLLSDGNTDGSAEDVVRRAAELKASGATISTISIGDGADTTLLSRTAHAGGGRFHQISGQSLATHLPKVMERETRTIRRAPIREGEPYTLALVANDGPMLGLRQLPNITGYGVVVDRDRRAIVGVRGPEGDPIVAYWNHGLGRVSVFTGDPFGPWAGDWLAWSHTNAAAYDAFWAQLLRWTSRPASDPGAKLTITEGQGDADGLVRVVLELSHRSSGSERQAFARARYVAIESGSTSSGGTWSGEVTLDPEGPGRFAANVQVPSDALILATGSFVTDEGEGAGPNQEAIRGTTRATFSRRGKREWDAPHTNTALLARIAQETSGTMHDLGRPDPVFLRDGVRFPQWSTAIWQLFAMLAAATFLADVAARRLTGLWSRPTEYIPTPRATQATPTTAPAPARPVTASDLSKDIDQRLSRLQHAKRRASERR